jgi:ribosomal protein L3 glutamine methyltransferase
MTLLAQRIATRRPAAYLTGEAWLQGLPFHVDERVIVPRSLIAEVLAEGTAEAWLDADPLRVLDLCTGNGSLAVLAALCWPTAQVDATDLSGDALAVARINVERHGVADRVALRQGDGLAPPAAVTTWCCATRPTSTAGRCRPCPPSTAPSLCWRWTAGTTAWTSSARCCATCRHT